mmetsp:Transcript_26/g.50  ORF Transcript_26/g.50 Transcript_26/m.50 type:complete len:260 (-) Transcript_26:175-954(-)
MTNWTDHNEEDDHWGFPGYIDDRPILPAGRRRSYGGPGTELTDAKQFRFMDDGSPEYSDLPSKPFVRPTVPRLDLSPDHLRRRREENRQGINPANRAPPAENSCGWSSLLGLPTWMCQPSEQDSRNEVVAGSAQGYRHAEVYPVQKAFQPPPPAPQKAKQHQQQQQRQSPQQQQQQQQQKQQQKQLPLRPPGFLDHRNNNNNNAAALGASQQKESRNCSRSCNVKDVLCDEDEMDLKHEIELAQSYGYSYPTRPPNRSY